MATRVRTTRGGTASPSVQTGTAARGASPSVRDPLLVEGPRVLIRLPNLAAGKLATQPPRVAERVEPVVEPVAHSKAIPPAALSPVAPASESVEPTSEKVTQNEVERETSTELKSSVHEHWPDAVIARTMPAMTTSNVVVQNFASLPPVEPKSESPRYVSLASAINQLQASEPAEKKPASEAPSVTKSAPKIETTAALPKSKPVAVEAKAETAEVSAALQSTVNVAAPPIGRFRPLLVMARNPKMLLTGLLFVFGCLAVIMFFVPSIDPIADAPTETSSGANLSANVAPAWVPPTVQVPTPSHDFPHPTTASQNAPAYVAPTFPAAPAYVPPPNSTPANRTAPAIGTAPKFNSVPSTATAPTNNQQSSTIPARTGPQPRVAEFEGGIVRPTMEASNERARPSYR